jgi:ribonuclease BN (tRNA processing enzyme)
VGCSGSFAGPKSAASCYLLQATDRAGREWSVLIELGSGAFGPLQAVLPPERLDAVLLTHLHPDHCSDMSGLRVYAQYHPAGELPPLPVYGPSDTGEFMELIYNTQDPARPAASFVVSQFCAGVPWEIGPFSITAQRVLHTMEAWGLRITGPSLVHGGQAVLAFSGDTDLCPALIEIARDADLLLAEASFMEGRDTVRGIHLTGSRAGQAATEAGAARLVLTHLPPWNAADAVAHQAAQSYQGPIHIARPRARYVL